MSPFKVAATILTVAAIGCASRDEAVTIGTASSIEVVSGRDQVAAYGTTLSKPLVVYVSDQLDHPVQGAIVTFATNGLGTLDRYTAITDGDGNAQVILSYGSRAGIDSVTATVAGIGTPAVFSETATPGAPVALFSSVNGASFLSGTPIELVVHAVDAVGNPVPGVDLIWTFVGSSFQGSEIELAENITGSDGNGRLLYRFLRGANDIDVSLDHSGIVAHLFFEGN